MPVRALACARGGWTYGPWVPKIQPMSNGAALTLDPLRLVARWSLRTADHVGRFSFLIADMFRGLGMARLDPPHARAGDRRRLRIAVHCATGRRIRGRGDEPADRLPVYRHAAAVLRRRGDLRIDDPRARPGAHGADPGRPHRRALRRRAGYHARHRAGRRARKPGPLARVAPADSARRRRASRDSRAHDVRECHRHRRGLSHRQGLARPHLRRLRVRRALFLPAAGPVVFGYQERLLRRRAHDHPLLPGVQHAAGRRGGGARHDAGGSGRVGVDPDARRAHYEAAAGGEVIELIDVHKRFLENVVLDGVSLEVKDGETLALLGPSGVGKSVTLKMINGLLRPDSGDVTVDGLHVPQLGRKELATLRSKIGYVFQYGALFDSMSVAENIRLGITDETCYNDAKFCENRVLECLRLVNLPPEVAKKYPAELSGGMKKRVGIARAIAGQPKYLLYDEPTSGLDPVNADVIDGLIERLRDELGVTSVVVSHDVRGSFRVADRVALLWQAKIRAVGAPDQILASKDPAVLQVLERDLEMTLIQVEGPRGRNV